MNNRLLVGATSGEVVEGALVFHSKVASHDREPRGREGQRQAMPPSPSPLDLREMAPDTYIYAVPQWQVRTEVVLLQEMDKKNERIQTLEEAVRGPLMPKIGWVNKRGE